MLVMDNATGTAQSGYEHLMIRTPDLLYIVGIVEQGSLLVQLNTAAYKTAVASGLTALDCGYITMLHVTICGPLVPFGRLPGCIMHSVVLLHSDTSESKF